MTKVPLREFAAYLLKKIIVEPFNLVYNLFRKLLYPKAWFYALFTLFMLRLFWVRDFSDSTDKAILIAMIVLIVWQEWGEFYDEYIHTERKKVRERAIKENMKGK